MPFAHSYLRWIILALLALLVGWRVVVVGMSDFHAASGQPEKALEWRANHHAALDTVATGLVEADQTKSIDLLARSLSANPLHGLTFARLATLLELSGDAPRATLALEQAIRLAPQQADTRNIAAAIALARNDLPNTLEHWNVVLHRRADLRTQIYPVLLALASQPANLPAIEQLLKSGPVSWWPGFMAFAANEAEDWVVPVRLYRISKRTAAESLTPPALNAFLNRLQREGFWLDARLAWLDSLGEEQLRGLGNVFNGSFEHPISNLGFDWINNRVSQAVVEPAPTQAVEGEYALRVHFRGPRIRYAHFSQLLMLPPGHYQLKGFARPEGLETANGLIWSLSCNGGRTQRIAATEPIKGRSASWRPFELDFSVPAEDCPAQILRLQLDGRAALDFEARGTVWFDAITIDRAIRRQN